MPGTSGGLDSELSTQLNFLQHILEDQLLVAFELILYPQDTVPKSLPPQSWRRHWADRLASAFAYLGSKTPLNEYPDAY